MSKEEKEELLKSLATIKLFCATQDCDTCPLRDKEQDCYIQNIEPCSWKIKEKAEETWRAFYD